MILALLLSAQAGFAERKVVDVPAGSVVHAALVAPTGDVAATLHDGKAARIVFGALSTSYREVFPLALSADGRRFLYVARGDEHQLRINDRVLKTFDVRDGEPWWDGGALTPDGGGVAVSIRHGRNLWSIWVNDTLGPSHELSALFGPAISADGRTVAALGLTKDDQRRVVVNNTLSPVYERVAGPVVSASGVVAYAAETLGRIELRHGEAIRRLEAMPRWLFISDDGKTLGFLESARGESWVRVQETRYPALKSVHYAVFGANARHVLYSGTDVDRNPWIGVNERHFRAPGLKGVPVLSADGSKVGYVALLGRELRFKVIDLSK